MTKTYIVTLTDEERETLLEISSKGITSARKIKHAHILLKADESSSNWSDSRIHEAFDVSVRTIQRVRKCFVLEGLDAALNHKSPYKSRPRKLDGHKEAYLVTLTCSKPPGGRESWTLQLLADTMAELGHVDSVSHETVRQVLKKTN